MKKILLLVFVAIFLVVYQLKVWTEQDGPLETEAYMVIPKGANSGIVAQKLAEAGVISHQWLFKAMVRASKLDKQLKAGEYRFDPRISLSEAMWKIALGDIFYRKVTLPEGLTSWQMVQILNAEEALEGEITTVPAEGTLLPETYSFVKGDRRESILNQASEAMQKIKTSVWEGRQENLPLKSVEELVVLASIIEKETGVAEERGLVASVFVNRLNKGMRLQTDPTVIYALTKGIGELQRPLYKKDLGIDSPYNTYKYYGLPPGPICNPGRAALEAAAHPEASEFLYFVAAGDGGHNFATTLSTHNQNVSKWKKNSLNRKKD